MGAKSSLFVANCRVLSILSKTTGVAVGVW